MYLLYPILILLSSAGIVFVLVAKALELKTGRAGILARASIVCDARIRVVVEQAKDFLSHITIPNSKRVFTLAAAHLFHAFGTAGLFVSKYYGRFTSRVKGKKFLKGGGVVSFFLKNVAESKGEKKDL